MSELEAAQYCDACKKICTFMFSGSGRNGKCGNCGAIKEKWNGQGMVAYSG